MALLQLDHYASLRQLLNCLASASASKGSSIDDRLQTSEPLFLIFLRFSIIFAPNRASNLARKGIGGLSLDIVKSKAHHVQIV